MKYQGLALERRRAPRDRRVPDRPQAARTAVGSTIGNCGSRARGRSAAAARRSAAGPLWNGWGPTNRQHAFSAGRSGRPHRRAGAAAASQMGVRVSRRDVGVGAADRRRRAPVRRQPERHRLLARRGERLHRVDVRRATAACARRSRLVRLARGPLERGSREFSRSPKRLGAEAAMLYFRIRRASSTRWTPRPGRELWTRKVDDHPLVRLTGSPALYGDRLYVPTSSYEEGGKPPGYACCTFRGSIVALDARTGEVIWKTYTIAEEPRLLRAYADGTELRGPSGGAIWSAPTIDVKRGAIYVGVGNTYSGAGAADHRRGAGARSQDRRACAGRGRWHRRRRTSSAACPATSTAANGRARFRLRRVAGARDAAERDAS